VTKIGLNPLVSGGQKAAMIGGAETSLKRVNRRVGAGFLHGLIAAFGRFGDSCFIR
jgi:hypothetical protein